MTQDVLVQETDSLVSKATGVSIQSAEEMSDAVSFLSQLNGQLKKVTEEKEKVTKPLNEALKAERSRWKPIETMLETAIEQVRAAMTRYQTAETKRAQEEADKVAARVGEGKGKLKAETAIKKMGEIDTPETRVETAAGKVTFKDVKKVSIDDESLIPREYLIVDEVAVRKAALAGVAIPGVRVYTEQVPVNTR